MGVAAVKAIMMGAKTANLGMPPIHTGWNGMNPNSQPEGLLATFFGPDLKNPNGWIP